MQGTDWLLNLLITKSKSRCRCKMKIKYDLHDILLAQTSFSGIMIQSWPNSEPLNWIFILPPFFFAVVNIFLVLICSQVLRKKEEPRCGQVSIWNSHVNSNMDSQINLFIVFKIMHIFKCSIYFAHLNPFMKPK